MGRVHCDRVLHVDHALESARVSQSTSIGSPLPASPLRIFVRILAGDVLTVKVAGSATVSQVKSRIKKLNSSYVVCLQQLVVTNDETGAFEIMSDTRSVHSYGLVDASTIDLVMLDIPPLIEDWLSGKFSKMQLERKYGRESSWEPMWKVALTIAERHDTEAKWQCVIGLCFEKGWGVYSNDNLAVEWFQKAADQGHAEAQYRLGSAYDWGIGTRLSFNTAIEFWQQAADQGHLEALYELGLNYNYDVVLHNSKRAVECFRKAANEGHEGAQQQLGYCYYHGIGVTKDESKAVEWYRKAADRDDATAKAELKKLGL